LPLAKGYHGLPEATAARFITNTSLGVDGEKMFRTGDWGRFRADGNIEYLGRSDQQTKIRGHRVELGEIEHALNTHPDIEQAIVVVKDIKEDRQICAYIVCRDGTNTADADLRIYLRKKLPRHMIPFSILRLQTIPLLPNNKIDYKSLPAPVCSPMKESPPPAMFRNNTEADLYDIWREALGRDGFGADDNLFDVGGHSLMITRIVGLVKMRMDRHITLATIFQFPTVRALAAHLAGEGTESQTLKDFGQRNRRQKAFFKQHKTRKHGKD
jgi:polyketide synthase PksJ